MLDYLLLFYSGQLLFSGFRIVAMVMLYSGVWGVRAPYPNSLRIGYTHKLNPTMNRITQDGSPENSESGQTLLAL